MVMSSVSSMAGPLPGANHDRFGAKGLREPSSNLWTLGEVVDSVYDHNVAETGLPNHIKVVHFYRSSAYTVSPKLRNYSTGRLNVLPSNNVRELESSSRPQDPEYFGKCLFLVWDEVEDAVTGHYIN